MEYREATAADINAIARLHADSWRRNYRGAYSDVFLDNDVVADRLAAWTERLVRLRSNQYTIVTEHNNAVVGFAHTVLAGDPTWGALLDNLHVADHLKRSGIGSRLMAKSAAAVVDRRASSGIYIWVLEQNTAARAFYEALGGACVGRQASEPPGGGTIIGLRYAWPDARILLSAEL